MQTLETARETLAWAANRLAEAHRDISINDHQFNEVLATYLLATRAYHMAIHETNHQLQQDTPL